jgi:hypothetical protein
LEIFYDPLPPEEELGVILGEGIETSVGRDITPF